MSETKNIFEVKPDKYGNYPYPYDYKNSIGKYFLIVTGYSVAGALIGIILDKVMIYIQETFKLSNNIRIVLQFLLFLLIIYIIEIKLPKVSGRYHLTTPGLFLITFAFIFQFRLFLLIGDAVGTAPIVTASTPA